LVKPKAFTASAVRAYLVNIRQDISPGKVDHWHAVDARRQIRVGERA